MKGKVERSKSSVARLFISKEHKNIIQKHKKIIISVDKLDKEVYNITITDKGVNENGSRSKIWELRY